MSKDPDLTKTQLDYLSEWKLKDTFEFSNKMLDITYTSKPSIFDHIVTVRVASGDKTLFTGLFNIHPPHDIMNIDLHGVGTPLEAVEIIRFLSERIKAPVRMDMSANAVLFTEAEIELLGPHLELIEYSPRSHTDGPHPLDGVI
jgi:hypothetical protein